MTVHHTPENWELLGRLYDAVATLKDKLEAKGFGVIATLTTGIYPACLTFIVSRNSMDIFSFVSFDAIKEEDRVKSGLFAKGEELITTDYVAMERDILLKRLAELENRPVEGSARRG